MGLNESDIFRVDKNHWYTTDNEGNKYWDQPLVDDFWNQLVEKKIKRNDFKFTGYIFPSFSSQTHLKLNPAYNYLKIHLAQPENPKYTSYMGVFETVVIKGKVIFEGCVFLGHFNFWHFIFEGPVHFKHCLFDDEARFQESIFKNHFGIDNCTFKEQYFFFDLKALMSFSISKATFKKDFLCMGSFFSNHFSINECIFDGRAQISQSKFFGRTDIFTSAFNKDFNFFGNDCLAGIYIVEPSFYRNLYIQDVNTTRGTLQKPIFSGTNYLFENIKLLDNTVFNFNECNFNKDVIFKNCDIKDFKFRQSNITTAKFLSCTWNIKDRLILRDEEDYKLNDIQQLQFLEDIYRQLKCNFDIYKDWELSGLAYISEMKARENRLFLEKDYISHAVYKFYDKLGGYTQNFKRPLVIYLVLTLLIFPIYYLVVEQCEYYDLLNFSFACCINEAYQKSLSASLPIISTDLVYENWWIKSLQSCLSIVLITFFILAIRKRFKQ